MPKQELEAVRVTPLAADVEAALATSRQDETFSTFLPVRKKLIKSIKVVPLDKLEQLPGVLRLPL